MGALQSQKKESQKEDGRGKNRAEKTWNWAEGVRGQPRQKESVLWCKCKNDVKGGNRKTDFQFMNNSVKGKYDLGRKKKHNSVER